MSDAPLYFTPFRLMQDGQVAQSVEQRTENPCVGGSIPSLANFLPPPLRKPCEKNEGKTRSQKNKHFYHKRFFFFLYSAVHFLYSVFI